jgi:tetratricopeptide (TPR) repeat protein
VVQLHASRAFARFEHGDPSGARADCEQGLAAGEQLAGGALVADAEPVAGWRQAMARLNNTLGGIRLYAEGDLDGAESCYRRALELRRAAGDQHGELDALINLGAISFERRDYAGAASRFSEGLASARTAAWVKYIAVCASNLGQARLAAGEAAEAITLLEEATTMARQAGLLEVLADSTRALAEARLRRAAPQEALADAMRSVEHAKRAGIPRLQVAAHAVAMECLLAGARHPGVDHAGALTAARSHLDAAVRILDASGHRTAEAEIAELRSKLERAERGWSPAVVIDRPSGTGSPPPKGG